jgi:hypothetical protein
MELLLVFLSGAQMCRRGAGVCFCHRVRAIFATQSIERSSVFGAKASTRGGLTARRVRAILCLTQSIERSFVGVCKCVDAGRGVASAIHRVRAISCHIKFLSFPSSFATHGINQCAID